MVKTTPSRLAAHFQSRRLATILISHAHFPPSPASAQPLTLCSSSRSCEPFFAAQKRHLRRSHSSRHPVHSVTRAPPRPRGEIQIVEISSRRKIITPLFGSALPTSALPRTGATLSGSNCNTNTGCQHSLPIGRFATHSMSVIIRPVRDFQTTLSTKKCVNPCATKAQRLLPILPRVLGCPCGYTTTTL